MKDELKNDYNVIINFNQSDGFQIGRRGTSEAKPTQLPPSDDIKVEVAINFVIFGPNKKTMF